MCFESSVSFEYFLCVKVKSLVKLLTWRKSIRMYIEHYSGCTCIGIYIVNTMLMLSSVTVGI